jgi:hypothetical protein
MTLSGRLWKTGGLWKSHWKPALVALAVTIGFGVCFASFVRAYANSHCAYLTSASSMLLQVEVK